MKTLIVDGCYTQQELRTSDIAVKETIGVANFYQEFMHWGNDYYCILFPSKLGATLMRLRMSYQLAKRL